MNKKYNAVTLAEAERLHMLMEECAEVIKASAKILRHGYDNKYPDDSPTDNRIDLQDEIGDIIAVLHLMLFQDDVDVSFKRKDNLESIQRRLKYARHQR